MKQGGMEEKGISYANKQKKHGNRQNRDEGGVGCEEPRQAASLNLDQRGESICVRGGGDAVGAQGGVGCAR